MNITIIGRWAFILGVLLSVLTGLGGRVPALMTTLFILGLIVGFLNVTEKESNSFLVAVIAFLVIGVAGLQLGQLTAIIAAILNNLVIFVSAAALVVSVKQILVMAERVK